MKKILCFLALLFVAWHSAAAYDFMDDIAYNHIDDFNVEVTYTTTSVPSAKIHSSYTGSVDIPSEVRGCYTVSAIGSNAFAYCTKLTDVDIPSTVTSIGTRAFASCTGLTSITIPYGVSSIGDYAFGGCSGLTSVISERSTPPTIQANTFNTTGLTVYVDPNVVTKYRQADYWKNFDIKPFGGEVNTVFIANGIAYRISNSTVGNYTVEVISTSAAASAGDNTLTYSGDITIPSSVKYLGAEYNVTSISYGAFSGCKNLTSVNIPNSVTSIGDQAFYGCSGLYSVTLPESITSIGASVFFGCSKLISVNIPNSVTSIGSSAFFGCAELASITIPSSVTSIGAFAFTGCTRLRSVISFNTTPPAIMTGTFPDGITVNVPALALKAYRQADYWKNFNIEALPFVLNGIAYRITSDSTVEVTSSYYSGDKNISANYRGDINIPAAIYYKGTSRVYNVTAIANSAFMKSGISSVTIPASVISIGDNAFAGCVSLTSVSLGNSVASIGNNAFQNCQVLKIITLPESVTSIGDYAFQGCTGLTSVVSLNTTPPAIMTGTFPVGITVYVPGSAVSAYRQATNWKNLNICAIATSLSLNTTNVVLSVGEEYTFSANLEPNEADNNSLTWESSNESVAVVDANGKVTVVGTGAAAISVNTNDGSGLIAIAVVSVPARKYLRGDVNGDGLVDVADINCLVNIILNNITRDGFQGRDDVNEDGAIDVADINEVVEIIFTGTSLVNARDYYPVILSANQCAAINYTWTDASGDNHTSNLAETAESAEQIIALINKVYNDSIVPGTHFALPHTEEGVASYTNQPIEGITLLLVEIHDDWNGTPGTRHGTAAYYSDKTEQFHYINEAIKSIKVIPNSYYFKSENAAPNMSGAFFHTGDHNLNDFHRFYVMSKGKARLTTLLPFYNEFELFSPTLVEGDNLNTPDFLEKIMAGESYSMLHDCGSIEGYRHNVSVPNENRKLENLMFFMPDYRYEYWDGRDNNGSWTWYNPEFAPKMFAYQVELNTPVFTTVDNVKQATFSWQSNLENITPGVQEEFRLIGYNNGDGLSWTDEFGNTYSSGAETAYFTLATGTNSNTITIDDYDYDGYLVEVRPAGSNFPWVRSNWLSWR